MFTISSGTTFQRSKSAGTSVCHHTHRPTKKVTVQETKEAAKKEEQIKILQVGYSP